jgi:response regulator RpfG family c-di-GMP phosphodiesterase
MGNILICDDDDLVRRMAARALKRFGHECRVVECGRDALAELDRHRGEIDVLLTDFHMPEMDGLTLLKNASRAHPDIIGVVMSGVAQYDEACAAVNQGGAHRLLGKPLHMALLRETIDDAVSIRQERARQSARQLGLAHENDRLRTSNLVLSRHVEERTASGLLGLVAALDLRDTETQWHSRRVSLYAKRLGEAVGLRGQELIDCEQGALLHDIGKIGVRDQVLLKPGPLDEAEWEEMRRHPGLGHQILRGMQYLKGAAEIVYQHHERWDGKGYPRGLKGEEIVIGARIFAVVDCYDAMTSDRPYRKGRPYEVARLEIERCSGSQFDPAVAAAFSSLASHVWADICHAVQRDHDKAVA